MLIFRCIHYDIATINIGHLRSVATTRQPKVIAHEPADSRIFNCKTAEAVRLNRVSRFSGV